MITVTRLEWEACDAHNCHCDIVESKDGDMVNYEDYAALENKLTDMAVQLANSERKCRELAAENAGLKDAAKETLAHWAAAEAGEMELMMDKCMPALRDAYCETPATDAFLAEVRAQALKDLCAAFTRHAEVAGLNDGDSVTLKEVTDALLHCAEQLCEEPRYE